MESNLKRLLEHYLEKGEAGTHDQSRLDALYNYAGSLLRSNIAPTISRPNVSSVSAAVHRQLLRQGHDVSVIEEFDRWTKGAMQVIGEDSWKVLYFLLRLVQPDLTNAATIGSHTLQETLIELPSTNAINNNINSNINNNSKTSREFITNSEFSKRQKEQECQGRNEKVHEMELMQDMFFPLQGKDGKFLVWSDESDGFVPRFGYSLSERTRAILSKALVVGGLFRKLKMEIEGHQRSNTTSETQKAFYAAMQTELQQYYVRGIIEYESLVSGHVEAPQAEDAFDELSIVHFVEWTRSPKNRLIFLTHLFRELKDKSSGEILSDLAKFSIHLVPNVGLPAQRILLATFGPMWKALQAWITQGEVHEEFFICATGEVGWKRSFEFRKEKLPLFIFDAELAEKIMAIGKCQRLYRYEQVPQVLLGGPIVDFFQMERGLNTLHREVSLQTYERILTQDRLLQHLEAIRHFMLFEQGDFSMILLELLKNGLNKPAHYLYRMNLLSNLDTAVSFSSSHLKAISQIAESLDATSAKQVGWDAFGLDYRVQGSVSAVLSPDIMHEYARLSHFSWNMRRAQYINHSAMEKLNNLKKPLASMFSFFTFSVVGELQGALKILRFLVNEMHAFISGIMSHLGLTLMQCWNELETKFKKNPKPCIDSIIQIHENYVQQLKCSFILNSNATLKNKLGALCGVMLKAESLVDSALTYHSALNELDRRHRGLAFDESLKEEALVNMRTNGPRLLQELMISAHSCARNWQSEFDDYLIVHNKLPSMPTGQVSYLDLADWNEYQRSRSGFHEQKYHLVLPVSE